MSEILTKPARWKYPQKWFESSHRSDCSRTSDTRALLRTTQIGRCRRCSLSWPPSPGADNSLFMAYKVLQHLDTNLCKGRFHEKKVAVLLDFVKITSPTTLPYLYKIQKNSSIFSWNLPLESMTEFRRRKPSGTGTFCCLEVFFSFLYCKQERGTSS